MCVPTVKVEIDVVAHALAVLGGEHAPTVIALPGVPSIVNVTVPVGAVEPVLACTVAVKVTADP